MSIINLNFTKMLVDKKANVSGKISITNNVQIKEVNPIRLTLGQNSQDGIKVKFEFSSKYNPDIGEIIFEGDLISIENEDLTKKILEEWKRNKTLSKEVSTNYLNFILAKCNIEALILSKEINLPPPIPLPKVQEEKQKESK